MAASRPDGKNIWTKGVGERCWGGWGASSLSFLCANLF